MEHNQDATVYQISVPKSSDKKQLYSEIFCKEPTENKLESKSEATPRQHFSTSSIIWKRRHPNSGGLYNHG